MLGARGRTRRGAAVAGAAALSTLLACGGDDSASAGGCAELEELVSLPPEVRPVLDAIVGPSPRLVDVLLRPWSPGDVVTQIMVFLEPEHAADAAAIAQELRASIDVTEVVDADEMRRQRELLLGDATAEDPGGAALRAIAIGADETERSIAAAEADPRVRTVVSEAEAGPYWAQFASTAYELLGAELDAVGEAADDELAADVAEIRRLAAGLAADVGADLADYEVDPGAIEVVEDVTDFVEEECDLFVEDA